MKVRFPAPEVTYTMFEETRRRWAKGQAEVVTLSLDPGPLRHKEIDQLISNSALASMYDRTSSSGGPANLVLDLRSVTFIDPYATTVVHSLICHIAGNGVKPWICLPTDPQVQTYCGASGLADALRPTATLVGEVFRNGPNTQSEFLVPLQIIRGVEDVNQVVGASIEKLQDLLERIAWPREVVASAVAAIKEVTMNVVEHADSTGVFSLQAYKIDSSDPFIIVGLSDAGVGVRATLARKYDSLPATDSALLTSLFDRQLTSREDYLKGKGMRTLRDSVRGVQGNLRLRSGQGLYFASPERAFSTQRVYMPGTHLRLALNGPATT